MQKRTRKLLVYNIAFSEISLLVLSTIAVMFMIGQASLGSAEYPKVYRAKMALDIHSDIEGFNVKRGEYVYYYESKEGQWYTLDLTTEKSTPISRDSIDNLLITGQLKGEEKVPSGSTNDQKEATTPSPTGSTATPGFVPKVGERFSFADKSRDFKVGEKTIPAGGYVKYEGGEKYKIYDKKGTTIGELTQNEFGSAQKLGLTSDAFQWNVLGEHLIKGLGWAVTVFGAAYMIGNAAGLQKDQTLAMSAALAAGVFAFKATVGIAEAAKIGQQAALGSLKSAQIAGVGIGLAVAAIVFAALYKEESTRKVTFTCLPWEPPVGGKDCEKCNNDKFRPCTEYRCRSLGQACQIVNKGTSEEKCAWINPKDVSSPIITPMESALYPLGLKYSPLGATRPGARGVKIINEKNPNKCLAPFTPLKFGITTDEPTQCKIDYEHTNSFANMSFYFGETNLYSYNHTQQLKLPGPDAFDEAGQEIAPILKNDGTMTFYVRCQDANGNYNVDEYVVEFCVDKGPDTTPPIIQSSSIASGSYIGYKTDSTNIEIYVNEPAECRWSKESKSFEQMENTMECAKTPREINAIMTYTCAGNLTGIKDKESNKFYFRCKDQPTKPENERNVMVQSYELEIKGTVPLGILSISPNGTITGSTTTVNVDLEVVTDDGAEEGKAICYFSPTENDKDYIQMFETNSFKHKQSLSLTTGIYKYYVKCVDAGGNSATNSTMFIVWVDKDAPKVTRIYKEEETGLKIVTDEEAECRYSLNDCNFVISEGLPLVYSNPSIKWIHYAEWKPNVVYYIKCIDKYGNEPNPNECSVIASASEISRRQ